MTFRPLYKPFPDDYLTNPGRAEQRVLDFWSKADVFGEQQRRHADAKKRFVFYEGPPTANGRPGIHHVFARAIKDAVCRFHWMEGARVERKAGWDTHGLPVELEVEKKLGISGKQQIEKEVGIDKFVKLCRESVFTYVKDWRVLSERMGYWLDYDHPYVTYEPRYVESVWYLLSRFAANGMLQKRFKVLPYCPRCGTGLSSHEVGQGYRDVQDPSVTVRFPLTGEKGTSLLVWTTTPWTLPSNVAVAVNPELEYVKVKSAKHPGELFWVVKSRVGAVVPDGEVVETRKGSGLVGLTYEAPFDVIDPLTELPKKAVGVVQQANRGGKGGARRLSTVYAGAFVTAEDGTGFVHIAPFYGADDYELSVREGLTMLRAVGSDGKLEDEIGGVVKGTFFKDADAGLMTDLKSRGLLFDRATVQHSYPFCWRCDTPLLYFASPAWFLTTTSYRDAMVSENKKTEWVPPEIGSGRFGEWLDGNVDWALSRARYWGTPLPVWECENEKCRALDVIDSLGTLRERVAARNEGNVKEGFVAAIADDFDPHRPEIDKVRIACGKCGGWMRRDLSVVDCWFDSGAMPFAQHGWPFTKESVDRVRDQFPADFIAEGLDQTRGWFYTLHAIATFIACVDKHRAVEKKDLTLASSTAYRACVVNGLVLDAQGRKMSKRLGNAVDPFKAMDEYGADAVRLLLLGSGALHVNRRFDPDSIAAMRRQVIMPLVNCLQFFVTYANDSGGAVGEPGPGSTLLDRWVLSRARTVAAHVGSALTRFDIPAALGEIAAFVDGELANWYVRRNRERFRLDADGDRAAGLAVLREVLSICARCLAPFAPFAAEMLWHRIHPSQNSPESVHLQSFPESDRHVTTPEGIALEEAMDLVLVAARLTRVLRERQKVRTTIPLASLRILNPQLGADARKVFEDVKGLLADEVNVDKIELLREAGGLAVFKVKPNFPVLGKKVGKSMKAIQLALETLDSAAVESLRAGQAIAVAADGREFSVGSDDVKIVAEALPGLIVETQGAVTVALDTSIDAERLDRARAREFKRAVNQARRDAAFGLSESCRIELASDDASAKLMNAIASVREAWLAELRALDVRVQDAATRSDWLTCELLDGETIRFAVGRPSAGKNEA